ncbi:hypothetical protein ACFQVD_09725 [Streptosporangium amethystogenes subsp. fukuiense]|uniref:Uncharacterized protein n=1 Tax=Streptosporangium amethystogenes subsp. fukuiense TaxID=698418 RepID=A0ABW2SY29_9ACTN
MTTLRRLVDDGVSATEAARTLKIDRSTAYTALAQRLAGVFGLPSGEIALQSEAHSRLIPVRRR